MANGFIVEDLGDVNMLSTIIVQIVINIDIAVYLLTYSLLFIISQELSEPFYKSHQSRFPISWIMRKMDDDAVMYVHAMKLYEEHQVAYM